MLRESAIEVIEHDRVDRHRDREICKRPKIVFRQPDRDDSHRVIALAEIFRKGHGLKISSSGSCPIVRHGVLVAHKNLTIAEVHCLRIQRCGFDVGDAIWNLPIAECTSICCLNLRPVDLIATTRHVECPLTQPESHRR